jgi:hypothetical protein
VGDVRIFVRFMKTQENRSPGFLRITGIPFFFWFFTQFREWAAASRGDAATATRWKRVRLPRSRETAFGFSQDSSTTDTRGLRLLRPLRS